MGKTNRDRFPSKSSFVRQNSQAAIAVCGKRKARLDISSSEVRKIVKQLSYAHAATKIVEHVGYGDPRAANTGFTTSDTWVDRNTLAIIHDLRVGLQPS